MAQVPISWTDKNQDFPAGTVAGGYRVTVAKPDGSNAQSQDVPANSVVTFTVDVGDYVATVIRLDSANNQLGAAASAAFNVPAPATVSIAVPDVVSVGAPTVTVAVPNTVSA